MDTYPRSEDLQRNQRSVLAGFLLPGQIFMTKPTTTQTSSMDFCKTCYNIVILHLYIAMVQSVAIELWYPCILLEQKKTFLLKYFLFINSSKTKDITAHGGIQTLLSLRKGLALIVTYNLLWVTVPIRH